VTRRNLLGFALAAVFWAAPVQATTRAIVRVNGGAPVMQTICLLLGCNVAESIGDPLGQVFLVTSTLADVTTLVTKLLAFTAVVDCEPDLLAKAADSSYTIPSALTDSTPVSYFGSTVPQGYVSQPAIGIVRLYDAQTAFGVRGAGTVAVIDTGVDPNHPALQNVLLPGYDLTRNQNGADETKDVTFSTPPTSGPPAWVSPNAVADIEQSTVAVVDGNSAYSAFGHGTMVAGVIHLVAPGAKILPFKVFRADGTGYASDILRAIYRAVQNYAAVINMSFNLAAYSTEVKNAVNYANGHNVICVAAAGNSGEQTLVYPAALTNLVMGVASTTNDDEVSAFSNYGPQLVWIGAPGEGIITTYPYGTYAAGWGTSFSTPFVAATAALLLQVSSQSDQYDAAQAIAHAQPINSSLGNGRLDTYQAVQAWRQMLGLQ